jgi:hypothetical protein
MKILEKLKIDRHDLISKLGDNIDSLERIAFEQQAEIERLQIRNKTLSAITRNYDWKFATAKAEAIKEFAERLKNDKELICDDTYIESNLEEYVDNLVKEMVGDIDEQVPESIW